MRKALGLMATGLAMAIGCAATQRQEVQEHPATCAFLGDACQELQRGASGQSGPRWVNPNAQPTRYTRVIVQMVGFFSSDPAQVSLADEQMLTSLFYRTLNDELAKKFQIVDQAGPDVALIEVAILDAEAAARGARSVTMVGPQLRLVATGTSLVTGRYPFSGGGLAVAKVSDSVTGQLIGAAVDRRSGGGSLQAAA